MGYVLEPQTFAAYVSVCAECNEEVTGLRWDGDRKTRHVPCGHTAGVVLVPNPRLPKG